MNRADFRAAAAQLRQRVLEGQARMIREVYGVDVCDTVPCLKCGATGLLPGPDDSSLECCICLGTGRVLGDPK